MKPFPDGFMDVGNLGGTVGNARALAGRKNTDNTLDLLVETDDGQQIIYVNCTPIDDDNQGNSRYVAEKALLVQDERQISET